MQKSENHQCQLATLWLTIEMAIFLNNHYCITIGNGQKQQNGTNHAVMLRAL
ncbi:hypothetical protein [Moraxella pluranimalium]|uniref:hypothetical protein n=1 Tax=Moraxella pluranimalium TaxID=470453 RepID=UPI0013019414|nr:hypothetical protein [Moraxella pluranimalium]